MTQDSDTHLTVIEGGKSKRSGNKATASGLTEKQERFVQGLASGLSNSESYRAAYDTSNMQPNTVHSEASKLASNPKVAARLHCLLTAKRQDMERRNSMATLKASDRVWRNVWRLAEGENVPPSVQQAALALAAKMAGMLTDKVEVEQKFTDSKSIEAEILERIQRLRSA
jgi:murein L,D-transpeptidase YcbB/YkuD